MHDELLNKVNKFRYLGVTMLTDMKNTDHLDIRQKAVFTRTVKLRKAGIDSNYLNPMTKDHM